MAAVRTFSLPHYEAYPVQVAMFSDVKNAEFLRSQLLAANPEFDYAFLDAAMVSRLLISALRVHVSSPGLFSRIELCTCCTPAAHLAFLPCLSWSSNLKPSFR